MTNTNAVLHAAIMNIPCDVEGRSGVQAMSFKLGHRQARHAAAELVFSNPQAIAQDAISDTTPALAVEAQPVASDESCAPVECGACHGSGWVVRDADIGTDQECFSCGGSGTDEDASAILAAAKPAAAPDGMHSNHLVNALQKIARWHDEFPATGKTWDDGTPMSYGAANGSNGERDYMRQVALDALAASRIPAAVGALHDIANMLEGYAESYDAMARQNPANPTVRCGDIATDIRQNMKAYVLAATSSPPAEASSVRKALEQAAQIAQNFGPSRPIGSRRPSEIERGRWQGEQAASGGIAAAIRVLQGKPEAPTCKRCYGVGLVGGTSLEDDDKDFCPECKGKPEAPKGGE